MLISTQARTVEPRNGILAALPADDRGWIVANATYESLPAGTVLIEANAPIEDVYFIEQGVASVAFPLRKSKSIEAFTVGCEGIIGSPLFLDRDCVGFRAVQLIAGSAYRVPKGIFVKEVDRNMNLRRLLGHFTYATMVEAAIRCACNASHSVEQRYTRWLLAMDDHVRGNPFRITHEYVAQILGVRRATVTVVAGLLHDAGYIVTDRGRVRVANRMGLEAIACECYAATRAELNRQSSPT